MQPHPHSPNTKYVIPMEKKVENMLEYLVVEPAIVKQLHAG